MLKTLTVRDKAIVEQFTPLQEVIDYMKPFYKNILESKHVQIGYLLHIKSSYRFVRLNKAICDGKTNQDILGQLADLKTNSLTHVHLFFKIQKLKLSFNQLSWEYSTKEEPDRVHVSYRPRMRKEVLWVGV